MVESGAVPIGESEESAAQAVKALARELGCLVVRKGATDLISDGLDCMFPHFLIRSRFSLHIILNFRIMDHFF